MKEESASEEVLHDERKFTSTNMLLNNLLQTPLHIAAQQLDERCCADGFRFGTGDEMMRFS